jgi:hypothetical protein
LCIYEWLFTHKGAGSSVGITTGYGLDGPGIESRWGRDFPHLSRPALGPTQPPVQLVPGLSPGIESGRGVTLTPHPLLLQKKPPFIALRSLGAACNTHTQTAPRALTQIDCPLADGYLRTCRVYKDFFVLNINRA